MRCSGCDRDIELANQWALCVRCCHQLNCDLGDSRQLLYDLYQFTQGKGLDGKDGYEQLYYVKEKLRRWAELEVHGREAERPGVG